MKREFQVGDRVAVYIGGTIEQDPSRAVGVVLGFDTDRQRVYVSVDEGKPNGAKWWVHVKQCRRLRGRTRRRVWINEGVLPIADAGQMSISVGGVKVTSLGPIPGFVEFLEARPRKGRGK